MVKDSDDIGLPEKGRRAKTKNQVTAYIGRRIKEIRRAQRKTQTDVAEAIGTTYYQILKYERAQVSIRSEMLAKIAKYFNVPVSFFYDGAPEPQADEVTALGMSEPPSQDFVAFLDSDENQRLAYAFSRIREAATRRRVIDLVIALADRSDPQGGNS